MTSQTVTKQCFFFKRISANILFSTDYILVKKTIMVNNQSSAWTSTSIINNRSQFPFFSNSVLIILLKFWDQTPKPLHLIYILAGLFYTVNDLLSRTGSLSFIEFHSTDNNKYWFLLKSGYPLLDVDSRSRCISPQQITNWLSMISTSAYLKRIHHIRYACVIVCSGLSN